MTVSLKSIISLFVVGITMLAACSTTENITTDSTLISEENLSGEVTFADDSELMILNLSDSYSSNGNSIPENFKTIKKKTEVERDLTKGFRIQIYSGEVISVADSIASSFRAWSDTTVVGYQAETYTFFKAPHYRVHIGDFHDKERALSFSKLVKRLFKDAWVVYDSVEPYRVPADTVKISFVDS